MRPSTLKYVIIASFCIASIIATAIVGPAISYNSSEEYCVYVAEKSSIPKEAERTYIKTANGYELFNPSKHVHVEQFYLKKRRDLDMDDANWSIDGSPCKLNIPKVVLEMVAFTFSISISIALIVTLFFGFICGIMKVFKSLFK